MTKQEKAIQGKLARYIKELITYTKNNGYDNPYLEMDAEVDDGSIYVLKFERIDLDKK